MSIKDLINRDLFVLPKETTVHEAAAQMAKRNIGVTFVSEGKKDNIVGIFSERDLLKTVIPEKLNVETTLLGDVMNSPVISIPLETSAVKAIELMDRKKFRHLAVTENGKIIGMLGIRDLITQVNVLEKQLINSSKLSVLGEFVSGVIHELNTPLMVALVTLEDLEEDFDRLKIDDKGILEGIHTLQKAIQRMRNLAYHLKCLAHFPLESENYQKVEISKIFKSAAKFSELYLKNTNMTIEADELDDLPLVVVDPNLIEQVFLNLIKNAYDAVRLMEKPVEKPILKISGKYDLQSKMVSVYVSDNGPGMSPSIIEKVFSPFFTTKKIGEGSGLGLGICKKIIEMHHGTIDVESTEGKGTTFIMTFPIADDQVQAFRATDQDHVAQTTKILVVEDESTLRRTIVKYLKDKGCTVEEADDGIPATKICAEFKPDYVITDYMLIRMNGDKFAAHVRENYPGTKIVLITGSLNIVTIMKSKGLFDGCLSKPFGKKALWTRLIELGISTEKKKVA